MPEALISRITSRGPGVGSGNSLSSSFRSPRNTTPFMVFSLSPSAIFERAGGGDDDLGSVGLLAEHGDLGPRLAVLLTAPRDDPASGERLFRPQPVVEFHVQSSAHVDPAAEVPGQQLGDARERHAAAD